MLLLHPTSRGVGLFGDKVYFAAADAVLIAIDAKTGNEVWKAPVEDYNKGYYMSLAPLVADGKVMVGVSGGELGVRGFVAAFDAETGKPVWKTYTVPGPGEPGSETWPTGDQWKTGGGPVWVTGTYDPEPISPFGAQAMAGRGWATNERVIIYSPRRRLLSTRPPVQSRVITSIIQTIHGIGTRSMPRCLSITNTTGRPLRVSFMSRETVICGCSSAPPTRSTLSAASRS
jgi:hypothetical protein